MSIRVVGQRGGRGDLKNRSQRYTTLWVAGHETNAESGKAQIPLHLSGERCGNSEDCMYSKAPEGSVWEIASHSAPPVHHKESDNTSPWEGGRYEQQTRAQETYIHLNHAVLHLPLWCPSVEDHNGTNIPVTARNMWSRSSLPMLEDHNAPDGWKS